MQLRVNMDPQVKVAPRVVNFTFLTVDIQFAQSLYPTQHRCFEIVLIFVNACFHERFILLKSIVFDKFFVCLFFLITEEDEAHLNVTLWSGTPTLKPNHTRFSRSAHFHILFLRTTLFHLKSILRAVSFDKNISV